MDKVSFEQAQNIAKKLFRKGYTQIEKGMNNWVFENGGSILTIPRHERVKNYSSRVAATRFLASRGIPVPEVLDYSPESEDCAEYLLVKKVDGTVIDLSKYSEAERDEIHFSAGEMLRRIHEIECTGYGRLDASLKGTKNSWTDFTDLFFEDSLERVRADTALWAKYGALLESEYSKSRGIIVKFSHPKFLHADFHLGNLLFNKSRVVAVLDLDIVSSGDPCWDTGHYTRTFNFDRARGVNLFREGYSLRTDKEAERAYCLIIWSRKIGTQARQRPEALKETIPELEKIILGEC